MIPSDDHEPLSAPQERDLSGAAPVEPMAYRASDLDRHNVAERLRTAAGDGRLSIDELEARLESAFAAKTYAELEPLLVDIPGEGRAVAAPRAQTAPVTGGGLAPMAVGGRAGSTIAIAIFGGCERKGRWVVPKTLQSFALFGGVELDLREAVLEDHEVTIYANAVFGGIEITVPDGVEVRTSGVGIFGGYDELNDSGSIPGAPVVHVKGVAVFGGVGVRRKGPPTPKKKRGSRK